MPVLQVKPNGLNRLNRKTIKYPRILLAKNLFTKKVQTVRKVQPSLYPDTLWPANQPRSSSCNASVNSCEVGARRGPRQGLSGAVNAAQLLPCIRDLYSRLPEMYYRQPWELQHVLFSLGYTDDLINEAEIAAAVEVARGDWPQWTAA
jgi:hypothetical protein